MPIHSVTQKKITQLISRIDNKLGGYLHRLLYAFDKATLGKIRIHPISFFKPEEDENIHLQNWDGFFVSFLFPFMDELPNYQHFDLILQNTILDTFKIINRNRDIFRYGSSA